VLGLSHRSIRYLRSLVWISTLGVGGTSGWTFYSIFKDFRAGKFRPMRGPAPFQEIIESQRGESNADELTIRPLEHYAKLWNCPLHGHLPEPVPPGPNGGVPPPPEPTLVPIESAVKLHLFTVADEEKKTGIVAVSYRDDNQAAFSLDEYILAIGSPLMYPYDSAPFDGKLIAVSQKEGPVFLWGGEEVALDFDQKDKAAQPLSESGASNESGDVSLTDQDRSSLDRYGGKETTVEVEKDMYVIGLKDQQGLSDDYSSYLRDAGVAEELDGKGGKKIAFKNVRPNGLASKTYGIKSGDVLVSINGVPVSSKSQAIRWVKDHPDLPKYVVVVNRIGQQITKTILVPRNK